MNRPTESPNSVEWKVQQPWILYANRLEGERNQLAEDKRELINVIKSSLETLGEYFKNPTTRRNDDDVEGVARNLSYTLEMIKAREVE